MPRRRPYLSYWPLGLWRMLVELGSVALVVLIVWVGWNALGPKKPEVDSMRMNVAGIILPQIVEDIRNSRKDVDKVALLHLGNDSSDYLTSNLREGIEQTGVLNLLDRTLKEKAYDLLNIRHPSYISIGEAMKKGKALNADAVLFGTVYAFESGPSDAELDMEISLVSVADGNILFSGRYRKQGDFSLLPIKEIVKSIPTAQRFLGWVLLTALLPVFTITFIRSMVRKESNKVNAFTLALYTIVDTILAYLMVGAAITGWASVLVFLAAIGLALLYNYKIMAFALQLET